MLIPIQEGKATIVPIQKIAMWTGTCRTQRRGLQRDRIDETEGEVGLGRKAGPCCAAQYVRCPSKIISGNIAYFEI